jgi:hypothetical protein
VYDLIIAFIILIRDTVSYHESLGYSIEAI